MTVDLLLKVGDLVIFNLELEHELHHVLTDGVGIVTLVSRRMRKPVYVVLFPNGNVVYAAPRSWFIKVPVKLDTCPLEEEWKMWGDQ